MSNEIWTAFKKDLEADPVRHFAKTMTVPAALALVRNAEDWTKQDLAKLVAVLVSDRDEARSQARIFAAALGQTIED